MAGTFGAVCPPVGMNVCLINSIARDIPPGRLYRSTKHFVAADFVRLILLRAFPGLALRLVTRARSTRFEGTQGLHGGVGPARCAVQLPAVGPTRTHGGAPRP